MSGFRRFREVKPADPGTIYVWLAVIGDEGAIGFTYLDWAPDATPEQRAMDTEWVIRFGQPLYPMGTDVAYHARQPIRDWHTKEDARPDCRLLDGAPCWSDGSSLAGSRIMNVWGADEDALYHALELEYIDTFGVAVEG